MSTLLCFGLGYSAEHFIGMFGDGFARIFGTVRGAERAAILNERLERVQEKWEPVFRAGARQRKSLERDDNAKINHPAPAGRLEALVFDGTFAPPQVRSAIGEAELALVSIPPGEHGDPVLTAFGDTLAHASRLRSIVYLSTVGVYGDRGGEWVDEATIPRPDSTRSRERLEAEEAWQKLGAEAGIAVAILRLAGIYGPGRNALIQVRSATARRIVKPGQVFNRIHVGDIAQAVDAAFARRAAGIFNVADDEPSPPGDPLAFAAQLLGRDPPPEIPFAQAAASLSPMSLSFWQECRRVRNHRLRRELGVKLLYPTYREGLRALLAQP